MKIKVAIILIIIASTFSSIAQRDSALISVSVGLQAYTPGVTAYQGLEYLTSVLVNHRRGSVYLAAWLYGPLKEPKRRLIYKLGIQYSIYKSNKSNIYIDLGYAAGKYTSDFTGRYAYSYDFESFGGIESVIEKVKAHNFNAQIGYSHALGKLHKLQLFGQVGCDYQRNITLRDPYGFYGPTWPGPSSGYIDRIQFRLIYTLGIYYKFFRR